MLEFKPIQEIKKAPELGYDLLNLETQESELLRGRIEKWKGLVRIFVHPIEKWGRSEVDYLSLPNVENLKRIEDFLAKILSMPEDKTPPIIIMEETIYIDKLKEWLAHNPQGSSQIGVYLIKTHKRDPQPDLEKKGEKESWQILTDKLTDLGVRKILMGGQQFEVSEFQRDWTHRGPWMGRCIGIAMSYLSKDKAGEFEVELSGLTEPSSARKYYNDVIRRKGKGYDNYMV